MSVTVYPALLAALEAGALNRAEAANVIASTAEGYAFPTNLDSDPPVGGLAPKTQAQIMAESIDAKVDAARFAELIAAHAARREA